MLFGKEICRLLKKGVIKQVKNLEKGYVSPVFLREKQWRSQNLKEVPQVFNVDDVTANDAIQRNQHHK